MPSLASPAPPLSVRGTLAALRWPTVADLFFSTKAAVAVGLSLLVGFSQNLENPYWSALTVYVLMSQPQAGAIRSKALFRMAGTLLGGAGAILLAVLFASDIGVLLGATIAAIVLAFYAKTLDRTPASYTWFATALTLAVIIFSQVQAPETIFAYATTRTVEIGLAILAIGLVDSIAFPRAATPDFLASMTAWCDRASGWAAAALAPEASRAPSASLQRRLELHQLAALLPSLDALGVQLPYDTVARPPRVCDLRFVRLTVAHLVASLSTAEAWDAARLGPISCPETKKLQAAARDWILERRALDDAEVLDHAARGEILRERLVLAAQGAGAAHDGDDIWAASSLLRLSEFIHHWTRLERTLHAIATGSPMPSDLNHAARRARPVRSTDYGLGLLDVAPLALALGFGAVLWRLTGWTSALSAMSFVFISLGFVLGTPGAVRSAQGLTLWITLTSVITLFYQFVVLPRVTAFPVLMAVLATGVLPLGMFMAMSPAGLLILANAFAFLGLQNVYAADFGASLEILLGSLAGCLIAVVALHLCGFDRVRFSACRQARALQQDIVDVARARRPPDADRMLSLSVDRFALFTDFERPQGDPRHPADPRDSLPVATDLLRLCGAQPALSPAAQAPLKALRTAVASEFATVAKPHRTGLQAHLEVAFDAVRQEPASASRLQALAALTGLRAALFPPARLAGATP